MDNNVFSLNLFLGNHSEKIFLVGNIFVSFGILLVTVGGSWDITNHLLHKPETSFSPPHALIYTGVAISLIRTVFSFVGWRNLKHHSDAYFLSLKIELIGIALLVGAGPFDFVWHSNFGLDGLLSPPHLTLISGMFLCSIGAMIGISRFLVIHNFEKKIILSFVSFSNSSSMAFWIRNCIFSFSSFL